MNLFKVSLEDILNFSRIVFIKVMITKLLQVTGQQFLHTKSPLKGLQ